MKGPSIFWLPWALALAGCTSTARVTGGPGSPGDPWAEGRFKTLKLSVHLSPETLQFLASPEAMTSTRKDYVPARWIADVISDLNGQFASVLRVTDREHGRASRTDLIAVLDTRAAFSKFHQMLTLKHTLTVSTPDGQLVEAASGEFNKRKILFGDMTWAANDARRELLGNLLRSPRLAEFSPSQVPAARASPAGSQAPQEPAPRAYSSDVDTPRYQAAQKPDDIALVVGIEKYSQLPQAEFAERDAEAAARHFQALGVPPRNVIRLTGSAATRGAIQGYVEEWLPKNAKPSSTVYFFYSGHGAPDPQTGRAYLVPWDGNAAFLQSTAYPLAQLYKGLSQLKAKRVLVVLDSCFSGAGGRSVLAKGARPLVTKVEEGLSAESNVAILAAASGDEITGSYEEQGHGIFTYFLLKGLTEGRQSGKSLYDYLKTRVQDEARRQNREQTPSFAGANFNL